MYLLKTTIVIKNKSETCEYISSEMKDIVVYPVSNYMRYEYFISSQNNTDMQEKSS